MDFREPGAPAVVDGSAGNPLRWGELVLPVVALAGVVTGGVLTVRWMGRRVENR